MYQRKLFKENKNHYFCYRIVRREITIWGIKEKSPILEKSEICIASKIIAHFMCNNTFSWTV